MRSTLVCCFFIWCGFFPARGADDLDSLLTELDRTLEQKATYIKEKEMRISALKESLDKPAVSPEQRYSVHTRLYEEYIKYICDSALYYIDRNLEIARSLQRTDWETETRLNLSYLLSTIGLGKESLDNLNGIRRDYVAPDQSARYYQSYQHAYNCLGSYASDRRYAPRYYRTAAVYGDSAVLYMDTLSYDYRVLKGHRLSGAGRREEALRYFKEYLTEFRMGTKEYAVLANIVAGLYGEEERGNRIKYLILSAMSDTKGVIRENSSLCELAILLYRHGQIEPAYEYMKYSLDDANLYDARLRSIQIAKVQPIIDRAYQVKNANQRKKLQLYLGFISVLSIFLLVALLYIYRQIKRLSGARRELHGANEKLQELNVDLSAANEQLRALNRSLQEVNTRLEEVNRELCEANHVKEEYIGHFLDLCSTYIDKLEDYRKLVNRKLASGQLDDLFKLTRSTQAINAELKDFYMNFDTTFLHLYPSFVQELNALLLPGEQFILKKGELLNTELRIFALIRLGISDSSKIASFLRYSAQTIYNYRTKVRNKAAGAREEFESRVMEIGSFSAGTEPLR